MQLRRARLPLAILGFATMMAAFETTETYVRAAATGGKSSWLAIFGEELPPWLALGLLTPLPIFLVRRVRVSHNRLIGPVLFHFVAGIAFSLLAITVITTYAAVVRPEIRFVRSFPLMVTVYFGFLFLVYCVIGGITVAMDFRRENRERVLAAAQLQEMLTSERLQALRSKLNPHFLFNTLNAISTLALQHRTADVVQTTGLLGDMLRLTLDDSLPQEIPLAREMELIDKYLDIQRIRFGDRLRIERSIDPRALEALVPSMLLQPLVENAIVHGVDSTTGPFHLRIEAAQRDGMLQLGVRDTGRGFAAAQAREGIGLGSTRERLRAMYGERWQLDAGDWPGGGAAVTVSIPLRTA